MARPVGLCVLQDIVMFHRCLPLAATVGMGARSRVRCICDACLLIRSSLFQASPELRSALRRAGAAPRADRPAGRSVRYDDSAYLQGDDDY
jgi:hypothetical protein